MKWMVFGLIGCLFLIDGGIAQAGDTKTSKVMVIEFNPILPSSSTRLIDYKRYVKPIETENNYVSKVKEATKGEVNYVISERVVVDYFPVKEDGFTYNENSYLNCLADYSTCHMPDNIDLKKYLKEFQVCEKRNRGEIDELIIWGGPYFGLPESAIAGPGGFFYNSAPITGTSCNKQLPIMAFSYERSDEMLHNLGHRVESVMKQVYGSWEQQETHVWNRFSLINELHPGSAGCGNIHYPPNTAPNNPAENIHNYQGYVLSDCDDWQNFPNLTGQKKSINCSAWGCTKIGYYMWWLGHVPRNSGKTDGKWNDWWNYVVDYECAVDATKCKTVGVGPTVTVPTVVPTATPVNLKCQTDGNTFCENHGGAALTVPFDVRTWTDCLNWCNQNMTKDMPLCQFNDDGLRNCWINKMPNNGEKCNWTKGGPPYGSCIEYAPIITVAIKIGDANIDGKTDLADFSVWKQEYLGTINSRKADFNIDGKTDLADFSVWKQEYLKN